MWFVSEGYLLSSLFVQLVEENKVEEKVCVLEKTCTELTIEDVNDEKVC